MRGYKCLKIQGRILWQVRYSVTSNGSQNHIKCSMISVSTYNFYPLFYSLYFPYNNTFIMLITNALLLVAGGAAQVYAATSTLAPQFSPVFPSMPKATGVVTSYNPGPYDTTTKLSTARLSGYPEAWASPPTSSAEVKKVYNMIDWSKVPKGVYILHINV